MTVAGLHCQYNTAQWNTSKLLVKVQQASEKKPSTVKHRFLSLCV